MGDQDACERLMPSAFRLTTGMPKAHQNRALYQKSSAFFWKLYLPMVIPNAAPTSTIFHSRSRPRHFSLRAHSGPAPINGCRHDENERWRRKCTSGIISENHAEPVPPCRRARPTWWRPIRHARAMRTRRDERAASREAEAKIAATIAAKIAAKIAKPRKCRSGDGAAASRVVPQSNVTGTLERQAKVLQ